MELAPLVSGVVFYCIFWTVIVFIVFVYSEIYLILFILAFRTYVSSCVHGRTNHPYSDLLFLRCDNKFHD
jgi:hypothetical protein